MATVDQHTAVKTALQRFLSNATGWDAEEVLGLRALQENTAFLDEMAKELQRVDGEWHMREGAFDDYFATHSTL